MTIPINVAITAATIEEADAFGEFIAASARTAGFTNVTTDTAGQAEYTEQQGAIDAMRVLNPEIFSIPVIIATDQFVAPAVDDEPDDSASY